MTPEQMVIGVNEAIQAGTKMTLVRIRGHKMPPNFPRGKFLCENHDGRNVFSYDTIRVLAWLVVNDLVKLVGEVKK